MNVAAVHPAVHCSGMLHTWQPWSVVVSKPPSQIVQTYARSLCAQYFVHPRSRDASIEFRMSAAKAALTERQTLRARHCHVSDPLCFSGECLRSLGRVFTVTGECLRSLAIFCVGAVKRPRSEIQGSWGTPQPGLSRRVLALSRM